MDKGGNRRIAVEMWYSDCGLLALPDRRDRHASFGRFYRGKNNQGSNLNGWRSVCRAILA